MRSPDAGPAALYLHIGRNKAGSTALQTHWMHHSDTLMQAGVQYVLFGQPNPAGKTLPTFANHHELADFVRARAGRPVLLSHEGLCCFHPDVARFMASDLATLDVRVIFYIRPYSRWVRSSYAFDVQIGENRRDFDSYLETKAASVSAWPALRIWGETLGWDRMRIRSLDPRDLQGGDLICDGDAAIGVTLPPRGPAEQINASPSWMTTELLRALIGRNLDDPTMPDMPLAERLESAEVLEHFVLAAIAACGESAAAPIYPTRDQAQRLAELYNRDLAAIAAHTGVTLQPDAGAAPERAFLPTAHRVPKSVLEFIRRCACETQNADPRLVALSQLPQFIALCDA